MHKQVTTQLIDISDAAHLFDLEDVLDHVFEQGFVDPKLRTPETALRLIIGVCLSSKIGR